jgi:hypothetical protein
MRWLERRQVGPSSLALIVSYPLEPSFLHRSHPLLYPLEPSFRLHRSHPDAHAHAAVATPFPPLSRVAASSHPMPSLRTVAPQTYNSHLSSSLLLAAAILRVQRRRPTMVNRAMMTMHEYTIRQPLPFSFV